MPRQQYTPRPRQCQFCRKKQEIVDFRDIYTMQKALTPWGKIKSARDTGNCAKHQRRFTEAIKHARYMGLMPYFKR